MSGTDDYVLPRHVSTNHPDGGAPLTREHLIRAHVRVDQDDNGPTATFRLATLHGDEPIDFKWNFAQFKDRVGAGWDTDVGRLKAENERLRAALDEAQLRSIEARNPGIDMDEVRASRLRRAEASDMDAERQRRAQQ